MSNIAVQRRGGYVEMKTQYISKFPLKELPDIKQQPFIDRADMMLARHRELHEKSEGFLANISAKYKIEKVTRKLEKWWELDFPEFVRELKVKI